MGSRSQCSLTLTCVEDRDYSLSSLSAGAAARRTVSLAIALGVDEHVLAGTWLTAAIPRRMLSNSSVLLCPEQMASQQAALHHAIYIPACHGLPWPADSTLCVCWRA